MVLAMSSTGGSIARPARRRRGSSPMTSPASNIEHDSTCPACGHHVAVPFFSGHQPLATVAWPKSAAEARAMPKLPLDFMRCVDCGHVFNAAFDYAAVPYSEKPNLMFNKG